MRQKGQAVLEFAFVAPMLMLLFASILYIALMFMDYIQYNNAARAAARDISVQINDAKRDSLTEKINQQDEDTLRKYAVPLTKILPLYSAHWDVVFLDANNKETTEAAKGVDVRVNIDLRREELPLLLERFNVLPRDLKTIRYTMRKEPTKEQE